MQLTRFTDLGLRVLMYLSQTETLERAVTIPEIAARFEVSRNHLVKVVHFMGQQGWIVTLRGRGGGLKLASHALTLKIGDLIETLEHPIVLIDCSKPHCLLKSGCTLKKQLNLAQAAFFKTLNEVTLGDLLKGSTVEAIHRLVRQV